MMKRMKSLICVLWPRKTKRRMQQIRFPDLPLELLGCKTLVKIAAKAGKPLLFNQFTATRENTADLSAEGSSMEIEAYECHGHDRLHRPDAGIQSTTPLASSGNSRGKLSSAMMDATVVNHGSNKDDTIRMQELEVAPHCAQRNWETIHQ
ncbi:hypothetical protein AXF42_Ash012378 [Apostasia shenzhenica]|uniref:Uncharacterized protein n=1 Tax=Apostasia shenzhenica TaxID=1088818 RepID=A0A2I0AD52_9ASPA|nr:hypothetical protein AXF42_Ash012378 [Apostasia shenzhenica]